MNPSEAIENIEYARRWMGSESDFSEEALDMAIFALKKLEQDRWIPCSERLPDKSKYYLVTNYIEKWGDKITETCEAFYVYNDPIYKTSYWCGSENHKLGKVIAWRELPEPYREESNNE